MYSPKYNPDSQSMIYDVKETQTPHVHTTFDKYCLAKNLHKTYEISDGLTKASTLHTEKQNRRWKKSGMIFKQRLLITLM